MFKKIYKLFTAFILLLVIPLSGVSQIMHFNNYSSTEGLLQITCYDIVQDSQGFIWVGTQDGVDRFDGYSFKHFRYQYENKNSLSENWTWALLSDSQQNIWMGTVDGLNCYNPSNKKFTLYKPEKGNPKALISPTVTALFEEDKNTIWAGTEKGLSILDKNTGNFKSYNKKTDDETSLSNDHITCIQSDNQKNIWVGTRNGLNLFKKETNNFQQFIFEKTLSEHNVINTVLADNKGNLWIGTDDGVFIKNEADSDFKLLEINGLCGKIIKSIIQDKTGLIWIGTQNGLAIFNPETNQLSCQQNILNEPYSLADNAILSLMEDAQGNIWIGTLNNGISVYNKLNANFHHFKNYLADENASFSSNSFRSFLEYEPNKVLIGTEEGILLFNNKKKAYYDIEKELPELNPLKDKPVYVFAKSSNKNIWIGTFGFGIYKFDTKQKKLTMLKTKDFGLSFDNLEVWALYEDKKRNLWIGTSSDGVIYLDTKNLTTKNFRFDPNNPKSLINNTPICFLEDSRNNFWIGTERGLELLNPKDSSFIHFTHKKNNSKTISDNNILSIIESSNGDIWVGTYGGLNRFNFSDSSFVCVREKDGLSNDVIYGIQEDENHNFWLSTNLGINKFNPKKNQVTQYDKDDGLQSNEYNGLSHYKDSKGLMYFGGINGFDVFHPDSIHDNLYLPNVFITKFLYFNKEINIDPSSIPEGNNSIAKVKVNGEMFYSLPRSIESTHDLVLDHSDYIFGFEFTALNFRQSKKNKFKYMLEGFEKGWTETDYTNRRAVYTNIPHGNYTFKVIASNDDGVWNKKGHSIAITIKPPWWLTWWAKTIWVILPLSILLSIYFIRVNRLKKQTEILEQKVHKRTLEISEKNEELQQQQEEILAQSESLEEKNIELEKLSIVARKTDNSVLIMDRDGNFEWVNDAFQRLYGYTLSEFKLKFGSNLLEATSNKNITETIHDCIILRKSCIYESKSQTKEGKTLWLQTTLTPIINGNKVSKIIAVESDINKLKDYELEIAEQKQELLQKNEILDKQNEYTKASIRYAQTIQNAILPTNESISKSFDNFIIYRPKDIVSGDFYWVNSIKVNQTDYQFCIVADCTGHGVAGAFMSMIGYSILNQIILENKNIEPAEILEELNKAVRKALRQESSSNTDGMDVCLCRFNTEGDTQNVTFAGAKRPLIYYNSSKKEIEVIKGSHKTIGGTAHYNTNTQFEQKQFSINQLDTLYLTSDGYIDQNNHARKRIGTNKLLELLNQVVEKPLEKQKLFLENFLNNYMQQEPQRDDITIISVRKKNS